MALADPWAPGLAVAAFAGGAFGVVGYWTATLSGTLGHPTDPVAPGGSSRRWALPSASPAPSSASIFATTFLIAMLAEAGVLSNAAWIPV